MDNNQQAGQYLDEVFELWSVQSVDEESGIEYRHPTSKEGVEKGQELLNEARACNPDDPEVINRINELQDILDDATTERFGGNKIFLYGVILAVLMIGGFLIYNGIEKIGKDYTPEQGKEYLTNEIASYEGSLEYAQKKQAAGEDKQESIDYFKERIENLKEYDGESYADKMESDAFKWGLRDLFKGLFYFVLLGLYYWSALMPQYMINKRQKEIAAMAKGTGWAKKILFAILGLFLTMPFITIYDKSSSGSLSYSSDNLGMGMFQLILKYGIPLLIIIIVAYMIIVILPILIIFNVLRNKYPNFIKDIFAKISKKA